MKHSSVFFRSRDRIRFVLGLLLLLWFAPANAAKADNYGAIAYSPSTGNYGYSYRWPTREKAESVARSYCKETDTEILTWFKGDWWGCLVMDLDGEAYGWGWGPTLAVARAKAKEGIQKYSANSYVALCVSADGIVRK